jgi:hypothetical protein
MKIFDFHPSPMMKRRERRASIANSARAFTMIEIAIALAVIAFALVAIIGVLPSGLNVQKENREDTIINQDGPYWVQAIRNGSKGLDYLTNYVDRIGVVLIDANTNLNTLTTNFLEYDDPDNKTGATIIGLLSLPKWTPYPQGNTKFVWRVEAQSRGLTGSAVEQGTNSRDFSFDYLLVSEVVPFAGVQVLPASTNFNQTTVPPLTAAQIAARKAAWVRVKTREKNTSEIRLTFRWPLLPNGQTGPGRQIFRAIASGERSTNGNLVFLQPRSFSVAEGP